MLPLERAEEAGRKLREIETQRNEARQELKEALEEGVRLGIPLARLAKAAGISRQSARLLVAKKP